VVALVFIGLPFVVRTLQPVLEDLNTELEEAAATPRRQPLADLPPRDLSDRSRRC
jgi:ABC-type sulfate transport system permease component